MLATPCIQKEMVIGSDGGNKLTLDDGYNEK